jgi:TolB protein
MNARTAATVALAAAVAAPTALALAGPAQAAFPGQNGRIAFTSFRDDSPLRDDSIGIDTINSDGSGQTRLVAGANPVFSADGSKIAFERAPANREREIYTMNADGSGVRRLTNNAVVDYDPAFSSDGSKIAFASFRGGNVDIYTMNADGGGQRRLTTNAPPRVWPGGIAPKDDAPAFSPDGSKIAFVSTRDNLDPGDESGFGNIEIYTMNADGSRQTNLTRSPSAIDRDPAFSPDGTKIAFASVREEGVALEIYTMATDGSGQTNITNNPAADFEPAFSPDGTKIAFESTRGESGNFAIYTMNADGSAASRLSTQGTTRGPDWQPRGLAGACANDRRGSENNDRIAGTAFGDRILGLGGDDILDGRAGRDCLFGDAGNDELSGEAGDDRLDGGAGNDRLSGGPGKNSYYAGPGNDTVNAANGRREKVNCGSGRDKVRADRTDRLRGCESKTFVRH